MGPARTLGLTALLLVGGAASALGARGTDLVTGYEWWDTTDGALTGAGFFDGGVTTLNPANDAAPTLVALPWGFSFYGIVRNQMWISDNGWISFQDPAGNSFPVPGTLPSPTLSPELVAPYWGDLDCSAGGTSLRHGPVNAAGAYRVQYTAVDVASGRPAFLDLYLFQDGRIKFQYRSVPGFAGKTVGIQDAPGTDGFSVVDQGLPHPGVPDTPAADYVVDMQPPPLLVAECGMVPPLACGDQMLMESLPGTLPVNIAVYGCGTNAHWARERMHALTLTQATRLSAQLALGTGRNLQMHLLQDCSERACLVGPTTSFDVLLGPGEYVLSVDGPLVADEGTYTLTLDCSPAGPRLTCGDSVMGDTTGGTTLRATQPCSGALNLSGPERLFTIDSAALTNLGATLDAAPELDVLLFQVPPAGGLITAANCLQWGDDLVLLGDLPAGEYLVVVDGIAGAQGPFLLETSCAIDIACALAGTVDFGSGPVQTLSGNSVLGTAGTSAYDCERTTLLDGRELVFELILPAAGEVAIREIGLPSGLRFFVLDTCNEGTCRGDDTGSCGTILSAGTHTLAIDSPAGAEGPFDLELVFSEPQGHWSSCEDLTDVLPPNLPPTQAPVWHFDDGAYCFSDPESHNYPDGCSFAMYVAIRCGTAFHVPLYDVESGHVRVFDVFREQYVGLTAVSTAGWSEVGTDIAWMDCTGTNPTWNDQTTDVFFENPDGLCGVYRLEFPQHAGFVWDLYANCTGDRTPGYPVFDSLCGALDAFEPLPDIHLEAADLTPNCPSFTASYTVENTGCADAVNVTVGVFDDGVLVATDVLPLLRSGESAMGTIAGSFPGGMSSTNVTVEVDPANTVQECDEVPGAGCVEPHVDVIVVGNCSAECQVMARATAVPAALCDGAATTIDASASTFLNCPTGALEYQLRAPGMTLPWQASPVFAALLPALTTDYALDARCSEPATQPACTDTVILQVAVDWHPLFDAASVAIAGDDCGQGILLSWAPATFLGPTGTGVYNVHRSPVSCSDAVDVTSTQRVLLATTTTTSYLDLATVSGDTYYYVVEAEDDTPVPGGCQPRGFRAQGAATRVEAPGGTCAGVLEQFLVDTAALPRVGATLRLGHPEAYSATTVPLRWSADRALDTAGGEHYHVERSDRPGAGFSRLNVPDPPLLQLATFVDPAAGQPPIGTQVQYYLVFVSAFCHADNRVHDPSTSP